MEKANLAKKIVEVAHLKGQFLLRSGKTSTEYFDKYRFESQPLLLKEIAAQIQGRKKAKNKLPTWFNTPGLIYPSTTSIEQASSEPAANYKASMIKGNRILDGSGGMGIDAMAIAMANPKAIIDYLEPDPWLAELMRHNCAVLGTHNILVHNTPLNNFITQQQDIKYDAIYIDPSRRDDANNRFINLEFCSFSFSFSLIRMVNICPGRYQYHRQRTGSFCDP